eukprot:scaffold1508_cov178-Amphora_coffeaeformis.AAC.20
MKASPTSPDDSNCQRSHLASFLENEFNGQRKARALDCPESKSKYSAGSSPARVHIFKNILKNIRQTDFCVFTSCDLRASWENRCRFDSSDCEILLYDRASMR